MATTCHTASLQLSKVRHFRCCLTSAKQILIGLNKVKVYMPFFSQTNRKQYVPVMFLNLSLQAHSQKSAVFCV